MVWYSHLLKNSPQFVVIHAVKGFGIVTEAEVDVFLELSWFFYDPARVFQICWHIEWSTFTASSFRIWKSSTGIPSPPLSSHWRVGICLSPGMTWAPHEHCRLWEGLTTRLNPEPLSGGAASCLYSLLFRFSVTLWPSVISLLTPPPIKATLAKLHREVQKMSFSSFLRLSPWDFYRMTPLFHFLCVQHK